jgi:hypothetical protein
VQTISNPTRSHPSISPFLSRVKSQLRPARAPEELEDMDMDVDDEEVCPRGTVGLARGSEPDKIVEFNQADHYSNRASELEDVSLYEFVSAFPVLPENKASASDGIATREGAPNRRLPFRPQHPLATPHVLRTRDLLCVPRIQGPGVPKANSTDPPTRERSSSCYSGRGDMLPTCWETTSRGKRRGDSSNPRPDIQKYMDNLRLLHRMSDEADKDRGTRVHLHDDSRRLDHDGEDHLMTAEEPSQDEVAALLGSHLEPKPAEIERDAW